MRGVLLCGLLAALTLPGAQASPIFGDGFEACCTVGGTISSLPGSGLVLRLGAGAISEDRVIAANGPYRFQTVLGAGASYSVSIQTQPTGEATCSVANSSGVMPAAAVSNIDVSCASGLQWDSGVWGEPWN